MCGIVMRLLLWGWIGRGLMRERWLWGIGWVSLRYEGGVMHGYGWWFCRRVKQAQKAWRKACKTNKNQVGLARQASKPGRRAVQWVAILTILISVPGDTTSGHAAPTTESWLWTWNMLDSLFPALIITIFTFTKQRLPQIFIVVLSSFWRKVVWRMTFVLMHNAQCTCNNMYIQIWEHGAESCNYWVQVCMCISAFTETDVTFSINFDYVD